MTYQQHPSSPLNGSGSCGASKQTSFFGRITGAAYRAELSHFSAIAFPIILTFVLEYSPGIVSLLLVGKVAGDNHLLIDAAAMAVMFVNLTGLSVGFGLATALDTLASQAVGLSTQEEEDCVKSLAAAVPMDFLSTEASLTQKPTPVTVAITMKANKRLSVYLQTGLLVLTIASVPIFFLNFFAAEVLIALGQPKEVALLAGTFIKLMLPGIPFLYMYELLKKLMQAQHICTPMVIVAIFSNLLNIAVGYPLVFHTSLGWQGAAVARTLCNMSFPLFLIPYLMRYNLIKTFWHGWEFSAAFGGIRQFMSLGIPGMLMMCFEWWAFELIALLSGWLPNAVASIGANAVVGNISAVIYMIYLGLSVSGNVRIGNALGAGDASRAKVAADLTIILSVACAVLNCILLLLCRDIIPTFFSTDPRMIAMASQVLVVCAAFQVPDALNGALQGVFRGSGRQAIGAKLNFLAYYVVGLPAGVLLAFVSWFKLGLLGLWIGLTFGLFFIAGLSLFIVQKSDWHQLVRDATARLAVGQTAKPMDEKF